MQQDSFTLQSLDECMRAIDLNDRPSCEVEEERQEITSCNGIFNFSRLPWVIFLSILEFFKTTELCRLCLVNKLWRKACLDPSLWRCLDMTQYSNITDEVLERLTSFSNNVVTLKISRCPSLTDAGVTRVLKQCPALEELSLTHSDLSDQVLVAVGQHCHGLKKLDISLSTNISDDGLRKVCQGCPELEELTLNQCEKLTSDALVSVGNHCFNLKLISTEQIANITDYGVMALLQGCHRLQLLRVPFCRLTKHCLVDIVTHCQDILWLDLRGISLEDNDVCTLVESCSKLECLNLSLCYNLTDRSVLEISKNCESIKYLFLVHNKVTDNGLFQLGGHCKNLQHLDVSWCSAVTQAGVRHVIEGCPNLRRLGLVRCDQVSESVVNELSSYYPHVFLSTVRTEMNKFIEQSKT